MTITEILAAVNAAGRSLSSNGTTITLSPGRPLPKAVLEGLREHKPALLELLGQADAPPAESDTAIPHGSPFVAAVMRAFPGAQAPRWLSDAEHDAIGFRARENLLESEKPIHSRPATPTAASMGDAQ
jgi:type II secretory pathway component PulJ